MCTLIWTEKQDEVTEPLLNVTPLFASVESVQKGLEVITW